MIAQMECLLNVLTKVKNVDKREFPNQSSDEINGSRAI